MNKIYSGTQCERYYKEYTIVSAVHKIIDLEQALLDIKEYIEHYGNIYVLKDNQLKNVYQWKELLEIVNKALGDKENE